MVNDPGDLEKLFKDFKKIPKSIIKGVINEELRSPCYTHLQCNRMDCKYNKPDEPDMGTITYCDKYLDNPEQEKKCKKECNKREWYDYPKYSKK